MTWTRTPQEYPSRADVAAVSRSARWLLIEAYSWSNAQLTDGRVPRSILRRISDAADIEGDVAELLREGLMEEREPGFLYLDWSNQEEADVVKDRARRNAEKTKRSRQRRDKHLAGDHADCVPPYCKLGVTGNATVTQPVTKGIRNRELTHSVTPIHSSPVQSDPYGVKDKDKDWAAGPASAGATPSPGPVENERPRLHPGLATVDNLAAYGFDVDAMTMEERVNMVTALRAPLDAEAEAYFAGGHE